MQPHFHWRAHEYHHTEKSADWYWALWIIALAAAAAAILFKTTLLAVLIVVGAFTVSLFAARRPRVLDYEVTDRGVIVGRAIMYPHHEIDSFNIENGKLIMKSRKMLQTLIIIPLAEEVPEEELRAHLKSRVIEEPLEEPFSHILGQWLGF